MYYWHTMTFLDDIPEDKFEAETISVNYIFFQIFKIKPLCVVVNHNQPGPKGPMPHGKEWNIEEAFWKIKYYFLKCRFPLHLKTPSYRIYPIIIIVLYPGKGVCADPVNGSAILREGGPNPRSRDRERQLVPDKGREKTWSVVRMRRRPEDKEDDPFTASECQHAQSKWCALPEDEVRIYC